MQRICRAVGWILALTIVVLSVVPPTHRPTTGASHNFEHLSIYFAMGLAFAIGYRDRLLLVAGGVLLFSGLIEIVQLFVPGRHARLNDFLIDAGAACIGAAAVAAGKRILPRQFGA